MNITILIDDLCSQSTPPKPTWVTQPSADDDGHCWLSIQVGFIFFFSDEDDNVNDDQY